MSKNPRKNFPTHKMSNKENSWYWSVLLKNYGNERKATNAIKRSKQISDAFYGNIK